MMKRLMTSTMVAAMAAAGGYAVAGAQVQEVPIPGVVENPGQPDPTDTGSEFTLTGCLQRGEAQAGSPVMFILTDATAATGEGRMVSAQGAGVPFGSQGGRGVQPSDPPDLVHGEYRVVGQEDVELEENVNTKVRLRGFLSDRESMGANRAAAAGATQDRDRTTTAAGTQQAAAGATAGAGVQNNNPDGGVQGNRTEQDNDANRGSSSAAASQSQGQQQSGSQAQGNQGQTRGAGAAGASGAAGAGMSATQVFIATDVEQQAESCS